MKVRQNARLSKVINVIVLKELQGGIASYSKLLADDFGIIIGAVDLGDVYLVVGSLKELLPNGLKLFAVSAPRSIKLDEPRLRRFNFIRRPIDH